MGLMDFHLPILALSVEAKDIQVIRLMNLLFHQLLMDASCYFSLCKIF